MADRVVENQDNEVPEIPEILEKVLLFSLDEAKQKLIQSSEVVPFTALAVKENLFIENHPGESVEACFNECSEDGTVEFEDEPAYIGEAPNFMIALKAPGEYSDDEIDEKYTAEDETEFDMVDEGYEEE